MKTPESTIVSTGDLGGHKIKMGIDNAAMAHIMGILTNMYSDREAAVIREYATNAWDAHIAAGNTEPIQILTPSTMSPYFKVIDRGVGLSQDDIEAIYSMYGASTKRGTNDQTGMLGIGAKSALALVHQFNLTSVKDGQKIYVSISRDDQDAGQMEVIYSEPTDEPNGVEISIQIPRSRTFTEKVHNFFRFWEPGTVLVDGREPERLTGRKVGEKFIINGSLGRDYVVMGNVAYPCENLFRGYNALGIVAFVPMGAVNFTPAREALMMTAQTKKTLAELKESFAADLLGSAIKDINEAKTHAEAWERAEIWKSSFGRTFAQDLTYKGIKIPSEIPYADRPSALPSDYYKTIEGKEYRLERGQRYNSSSRGISHNMLNSHMFVTGFAASMKMSPVQREKAAIYARQQRWGCNRVIIFHEDHFVTNPDHLKFLSGAKIAKWEDIAKIKVARVSSGTTKNTTPTEPYEIYCKGAGYTTVSTFDLTRDIIYFSTAENARALWLTEVFPDAQIVILTRNRWEKFQRDWPTAKHWEDALKELVDGLLAQTTKDDHILWHYAGQSYLIRGLDPDHLDDPELATFVRLIHKGIAGFSTAAVTLRNLNASSPVGIGFDIPLPENPLHKYPLSGRINSSETDHMHWYYNAFYAHLNSQEN